MLLYRTFVLPVFSTIERIFFVFTKIIKLFKFKKKDFRGNCEKTSKSLFEHLYLLIDFLREKLKKKSFY